MGLDMKLRTLVAGLFGSLMLSSAALATDTPQLIVPPPLPTIVVPAAPSYDWAGAYLSAAYQRGSIAQGALGFNIVRGNRVTGAEILAGYEVGGGGLSVGLGLRTGVLVGDRDRLLVYASARLYWVPGNAFFPMTLDAGAEVKLTDRLSVFAEGGLYGAFGGGGGLDCCGVSLHAGVTFRLGR